MLRTFMWLAGLGCALCLSTAVALGLGEIEVKSKLNQRLSAVIPMTSVSADEAEASIISLGSNEDFERAGIERTEFLSSLRFAVATDGGNPRILVSSALSTREPFLSFLIDVRGKSGRTVREYTVLLDPPDLTPAKPAVVKEVPKSGATTDFFETPEEQARRMAGPVPAPAAAAPAVKSPPPVKSPAPPAMTPQPDAPAIEPVPVPVPSAERATPPPVEVPMPIAPISEPARESAGTYGPVQEKETLWSIASKLRPDPGISMDQAQLAIYRINPKSFDGFQGLLKGSILTVPSAAQMLEISPAAAKSRVAELRGTPPPAARVRPPRPSADLVPPEPEPAPVIVAPPAPVQKIKPMPPPPPVAEKPLLVPVPPPAVEKKPEPVVPPPAKPVEAPAPDVVQPVEPQTATPAIEEPLIPPPSTEPALIETPAPPAQVTAPPVAAEPPPPAGSDNSGLYLWLMVGVVLLGAGGFLGWRFWKSQDGDRKTFIPSSKARKEAAAAAFNAVPATPPPPEPELPLPDANLADFDSMNDTLGGDVTPSNLATQSFDATSETPAHKFDTTLAMSTGQGYKAGSTQSLDSTAARTAKPALAPVPASERVDFDVTSQFAAETMSINLDANDPVSEADFHLAYGLYDEAALLLKQAAEKEPGRTDVRVKLAETYFAASRPADFQQVAESLQGQLPDVEWQKLAIMGRQLCPDAEIFAGADDHAALGGDIDLSFDEPAAAAEPAFEAAPAQDLGGLDFKLEELELPKLDEAKLDMPVASRPPPADASLDFKLADVNFNATSPGTAGAMLSTGSKKFEITNSMQTVAMNAGGDPDETMVQLDDFDLNEASTAISSGDEASTKLDLARAYADMGDNDMARTLLKEVAEQGNASQQKEAESLMSRLA